MFVEFSVIRLIFWVFLISFLPGALLALALFKKNEHFKLIEKILIGFGIGLLIPAFIVFLLNLGGIKYSYTIAILSVVVFYIAAVALFIKQKAYEGICFSKNYKDYIVPAILIVIVFLAFWVRVQSYSAIFQELDPYFYVYGAQQIVTLGQQPFNDLTAWYPEVATDHRYASLPQFMEALWYSFYTQGGSFNNYLLFDVAGIYPAVAAGLICFFIYLFVSSQYKREYGLLAAALIAFMPIFLIKLAGGEPQVLPFAFLTISMFLAFYALALKSKNILFAVLASLSFAALAIGTASLITVIAVLVIFIPLYAILLFLKDKDNSDLLEFLKLNGIIFLIGTVLFYVIIFNLYLGSFGIIPFLTGNVLAFLGVTLFCGFLYFVKPYIKDKETARYFIIIIMFLGIAAIVFTPLGNVVKSVAGSGLELAKFNYPLQQTIAEQNLAGSVFQDYFGFVAKVFSPTGGACPINGKDFECSLKSILNLPFYILNLVIKFIIGVDIKYIDKENSLLLVFACLYFVSILYSAYKNYKYEKDLFLLFVALFPLTFVGILKIKFITYSGYVFAILIAITFAELEFILNAIFTRLKFVYSIEGMNLAVLVMFALAGFVSIEQFLYQEGYIPAILSNSLTPRFQDNPLATGARLKYVCDQLKIQGNPDPDICAAALDPIGYANQGTNYQFSQKLCYVSLISNIFSPSMQDQQAASYRCQRINDYWIDSMEWIKTSTENNSRTISWWDYGHWINYLGQKNTVLRNEHSSAKMIGEVAYDYIAGTAGELRSYMKYTGANYALFDQELVLGGLTGGKFGALNYLSCARNNETDVSRAPSTSICEFNHRWEIIYVPKQNPQSCTVSPSTLKAGVVAFKLAYTPDESGRFVKSLYPIPTYCIADAKLATNETVQAAYYLNQTYPNGDLKLNKAFIRGGCNTNDGFNCDSNGQFTGAIMFYTKEKKWLENGEVVDGYADRLNSGTYFYDSNLYKGFFLNEIEGFNFVYQTKNGEVKIYKLKQ